MNELQLIDANVEKYYDEFYKEEVPVTFQQKCPVILVLDNSGSMRGNSINQLNTGLEHFQNEISKDTTALNRIETCIVTFNSNIETVQDFAMLDDYKMPTIECGGTTRLVDGVREAIIKVVARKKWYKEQGLPYYRPYLILITDGAPNPGQDIKGLSEEVDKLVNEKALNFWSFGVEGADMNTLTTLSHKSFPPLKLKDSSFVDFFQWLSASMIPLSKAEEGQQIDIMPNSENENPFQISI